MSLLKINQRRKKNQITITNDKGRLSKDDIERMLAEAEKFKAEDETNRSKVEAKNQFEGYVFNIRNTIQDENVTNKIDPSEKETIEKAVQDATTWLDNLHGELVTKEEYDRKQKEIEKIVNPIITKLYQQSGAEGAGGFPGGAGGFPGGAGGFPGSTGAPHHHPKSNEPSVEEVD